MFEINSKQNTALAGINTLGFVSLLAYSLRTFTEINNNIEDLRSELEQMKGSFNENNKRSSMAFNKLNQKIESQAQYANTHTEEMLKKVKKLSLNPTPSSVVDEEEEIVINNSDGKKVDDISSAIQQLMSGN